MAIVIRRHCAGIKLIENMTHTIESIRVLNKIMIYSDNMITQQSTSGVISYTNEWSNSSTRRKQIKRQKITINNVDVDTTPLCRDKNKLNVTV